VQCVDYARDKLTGWTYFLAILELLTSNDRATLTLFQNVVPFGNHIAERLILSCNTQEKHKF